MIILKAISFHLTCLFAVVWVECMAGLLGVWLPLSGIYVFYVMISRGLYQALICMSLLMVYVESTCGYNNGFLSLSFIFVAYFWRDIGDCRRFFPQFFPCAVASFVGLIMTFLWVTPFGAWGRILHVFVPAVFFMTVLSPLMVAALDFVSDSAKLPRFTVLDNYIDEIWE
jgi:hypothetical protein